MKHNNLYRMFIVENRLGYLWERLQEWASNEIAEYSLLAVPITIKFLRGAFW